MRLVGSRGLTACCGQMSEERPDDQDGPREPSEMFSVRSATAIPTLTNVPLTPEEVQRRRRVRLATVAAIVVAVLIAAAIGLYAQHRAAISSARAEAERTGRLPDIAAAIEALEGESGGEDVALLARLHAMAELAGEPGHREPAEALLAGHEARGDGASDHAIALVYLALASGDVPTALREVAPLSPTGPRAAESARARALVASAVGDLDQALGSARTALEAMPDAPRHRALLIEIAARAGAEVDATGDDTAVVAARALAVISRGGSTADARREADAVLATSDATPVELARARLVLGLAAAVEGDTALAGTRLTEAASSGPAGDELFRRSVAEGFLIIGRPVDATSAIADLGTGATADVGLHARVAALLALSSGNLIAAQAAITAAPESARRAWVEGRILAASGVLDQARARYAFASAESFIGLVAASDLALLEVHADRGPEALAAIEPKLAEGATMPRVASAGALALSLAGQTDRALTVVQAALVAHPDEGSLLAALGRVQLAAHAYQPAADALSLAITHASTDATLHRDLGVAQRELGQPALAIASLRRSIELDATDPLALLQLLALEVAQNDFEGASTTLGRVDAAHLASLEIDHLRARTLVGSLAGQSGVRAVQIALRGARRDGDLHMALGRLYLQAERWSDAAMELAAADPTDEPPRRAPLLRLMALARMGRERPVELATLALREQAAETPFANDEEAILVMAGAWVAWHDGANERAGTLARRALELDPGSSDALLLLGDVDLAAGRDPETHLRAAAAGHPPSVEALGLLALRGELDAERCDLGRRYLTAAPAGGSARELRPRIATCP